MAVQHKIRPKKTLRNLYGLSRRLPRKFVKDETGSVTIEFVLWVPVFVLILAITVDATILFMTQANLWSIARDTTRQMATGLFSDAQAEDYALDRMAPSWGGDTEITASRTGTRVKIVMSVPIADVSPFNIVGTFSSGNIGIVLEQHVEPR